MPKRYEPKVIEPLIQAYWDENKIYEADLNSDKPKYMAMGMFNYPSGKLHIGHALSFTIPDVMARFKRQQGFESYHPVGWDSFGLPAENYAVKMGVKPQITTMQCIEDYRASYRAMGWSNDWSKEIATHTPEYYRWSQWLFSEMYRNGLAYQDSKQQWWCEKCQTVLANEQIEASGKCWRHDSEDDVIVGKKEVRQWFFRVTDYADEMLEATDALDWTETVKLAQKNWIGKSEGVKITFELNGLGAYKDSLEVFTTAHDTIYGTTFMVLAPEHPVVTRYGQLADNAIDISDYVSSAARKSEVERLAEKHKNGVQVEGLYAVNPINGAKIPVWVAEYVLIGYGSGAVMAVPGEDERDFEFANKYGIPIIYTTEQQEFISYSENIKPDRKSYLVANSEEFNGQNFEDARKNILEKLVSLGVGEAVTQFRIRDWSVTRQRYWGAPTPIIYCEDCGPVLVSDDQLPVLLPEIDDFAPSGDGRSALARAKDWLKVDCPTCGKPAERETDTLDTYICSSWYMFRYLDPHNSDKAFDPEIAQKWMPIDFYDGADHATAHLIYARFVARFFYKLGLSADPEPFKKFLFHGKITAGDGTMFSKSKGNGINPLDIIDSGYGADALRTYLMFAAPLELWVRWDPQGVPGTYRFLNRVWNITQEFIESATDSSTNENVPKIIHPAIKKVTADIESQKYNTAIASLMKCCNELYEAKAKDSFLGGASWRFALEALVTLIAPFAPHTAEQLWKDLGHKDTVNKDNWPILDEKYLVNDRITYAVQVNGKLRGEVEVSAHAEQDEVVSAARANEKVASYVTSDPKKVIFVKGKLVSFVV